MKTLMILCFVLSILPGCNDTVTRDKTFENMSKDLAKITLPTVCIENILYDVYDYGNFIHYDANRNVVSC